MQFKTFYGAQNINMKNIKIAVSTKYCFRFVLKIADYGLPSLRSGIRRCWNNPVDAMGLLWTAPEQLRKHNQTKAEAPGTQLGCLRVPNAFRFHAKKSCNTFLCPRLFATR